MRISGHKARSMFDRYSIVSESDLAEAARRVEQGRISEFGHSLGMASQDGEADTVTAQLKSLV